MVLVLDTARFKYPPHWLLVSDLWDGHAGDERTDWQEVEGMLF